MTVDIHVDGGQKAKELLSVSSAQQLWEKWELQCLVLASFTLQAFFLFAASIRRRNKSAVLRILLWLAYLSADYVAVFVLGHLTLKMDDPQHQLVLLWAPVLLLHLGGQDTITAFSMEDNELWKRHLLGLLTQVAMAVYVVAKSWRSSSDGLLVATVALMFVSGTVKYAERTWALKTATSDAIKDSRMSDLYEAMRTREAAASGSSSSSSSSAVRIQRYNQDIVGRQKWWLQEEYADLVQAAGDSFPNCMNALMDIPVAPWLLPQIWGMIREIQRLRGPATQAAGAGGSREEVDAFPSRAYKLGEIQLSLMYDHLYTKVGLRYAQRWPVVGLGLPLLTLATTSSALALFAAAATRKKDGGASYSAVDVAVSYVLLGGAVALEVLSILTVTLSFRSYCFLRDKLGAGGRLTPAVFWLVRSLRPYDKPLWSNKWAQYNLLAGCIREKQAGVFKRAMRRVGLAGDTELRRISDETKALICNELDDQKRLSKFSHARGTEILLLSGHGEGSPLHKSIAKVDFSTSVVMWHLVTDMCFFFGGKPPGMDDGGGRHAALAREVSSYLMDLVMERRVLISSEGHVAHRKARDEVKQILARHEGAKVLDAGDADAMRKLLEAGVPMISDPAERGAAPEGVDMVFASNSYETMRPVLPRAWRLAQLLLQKGRGAAETGGGAPPWEIIASVWVEMLFHLATRCEAGFHAKNLSTGGEFITHVRFLLLNRGIGWNFILGRA
ncbi:uncharacterized protein LOC120685582 [Panicum virgatum]|uniref:DUF4220 domain-containing protein n=1 Tax=Panicum virgatum TaxID=38727 RepID=A0A8T0PAI5_PANVG|nr:uncharacterized protein LOC120685582 [Panicum virgatum]KAG2559247.1 hypothetical protein PVAP13_8NG080636 [Panicum virgatum]KAG2559248.1 hypothetical protein PVAP13_8NG080636 [Panicum virgatum]